MIATIASQPLYWTCYFPVYHYLSDSILNKSKSYSTKNIKEVDNQFPEKKKLTFGEKILAVSVASSVSGFIVNPLFVFKTRFQTSALTNINTNYVSLIKTMIKNEGIRGFYKGNLVAQFKNTQMVVQMPLYDYFTSREVIQSLTNSNTNNGAITFGMGCLAKLISSTIYYPLDNIRTNIRRYEQHKSISKIISEIYSRPGGIMNFYRGVGLYWISAVPTFGLIMYSYEKIKALSQS